jgi:hypothetical protein
MQGWHGRRLGVLAVAAALAGGALGMAPAARAATALDVEIAVDTTGSMQPSIAQATASARSLVRELRRIAPDLNVAIVQFRDAGDTPKYEIVQSMTKDAAAIDAALGRLSAGGGGDTPEAYNLVFRNSYADPSNALGWRAASRKVVVVIGDAEPHGAGSAGIPDCADTSTDPDSLNTASELAGMRAARRTLLMVRQGSSARASLACYRGLSARAFTGGGALDGDDGLVEAVDLLVGGAVARRVAVNVRAFANNVRNLPSFQLGRSRLAGRGIVLLRKDGRSVVPWRARPLRLTDRDDVRDRRYPRHRVTVQVINGEYRQFAGSVRTRQLPVFARQVGSRFTIPGPVRVLTLRVRVIRTNLPGLCRRGTRGVIRVIDSSALLSGGRSDQTWDIVETRFPLRGGPTRATDGGLSCRTHNHGWTNADNANTQPRGGGLSRRGHYAVVSLTPRI